MLLSFASGGSDHINGSGCFLIGSPVCSLLCGVLGGLWRGEGGGWWGCGVGGEYCVPSPSPYVLFVYVRLFPHNTLFPFGYLFSIYLYSNFIWLIFFSFLVAFTTCTATISVLAFPQGGFALACPISGAAPWLLHVGRRHRLSTSYSIS